jgi:hypothetical protein
MAVKREPTNRATNTALDGLQLRKPGETIAAWDKHFITTTKAHDRAATLGDALFPVDDTHTE